MKNKKINEITKEDIISKIIIYPTDTVYGIGCNALDDGLVSRLYDVKKRERQKPVSVIAPSKNWIIENFICEKEIIEKYLPGAYTLILKKKDKSFLSGVSAGESVGIRMLKHKFQDVVSFANVPFVTTSANISGDKTPESIGEIAQELKNNVDIIIDEGALISKPSKIIDFSSDKKKIIRE